MPSSSTSIFSEPDEFEAALGRQTDVNLLLTGQGRFRGRLTQVALHRLHLAVSDEVISRIAFMSSRPNLVLVWWVIGRHASQVWRGTPTLAGEIMILGPGDQAHARTQGASCWAGLWIPTADLDRYSQVLNGTPCPALTGACSWRPNHTALRTLRVLHAAAIRMFENRPGEALSESAVHGLEQQLVHALVECLSCGAPRTQTSKIRRPRSSTMAYFEDACVTHAHRAPTLNEFCVALGVPARTMRSSCAQHLGMSPMNYFRLHKMKSVRRALRSACPAETSVSELARRHGITDLGRFAARYRQSFGELPSATLQRSVAVP